MTRPVPPTRSPLGKVIDEQGRRVTWMARKLGINNGTVSRWASGERTIPADKFPELAALLGVPEEALR